MRTSQELTTNERKSSIHVPRTVVVGVDNGAEIVEQGFCGLCHRFQGSPISFSGGCGVSAYDRARKCYKKRCLPIV